MAAKEPQTYCEFVKTLPLNDPHRIYHDTEYGFPLIEDNAFFGRLILEINQAGLSWTTILNKKDNFYTAYDQFDIRKIANYREADVNRLLNNPGIIRNKLKVRAAVHNANQILVLQQEFGSFKNWLEKHRGNSLTQWVKLFKKSFKFTGGEITKEFLMSTGYLPGAHNKDCPIWAELNRP